MISVFDKEKLEIRRKEKKLQPYKIKQIYKEIFDNSNISFQEMTTLSKELRDESEKEISILPYSKREIIEGKTSTKFLIHVDEKQIIESILMHHYHTINGEKKINRFTLCVSSQVGCPVGCIFCVTGKLGFGKNLSTEEILGQALIANNYLKKKFGKKEDGKQHYIRNIVFMGMGEPLLNYENMKKSIEYFLGQEGLGLSKRHITISTSGIIPGIEKLIIDGIDVKLALSLHAPNQELREELIPTIAKTYTLEKLMKSIDEYTKATKNRIFYEYIMIKNKTDTNEIAHELGKLLQNRLSHINLIPYNKNPVIDMEESDTSTIQEFRNIVESYGITITVRDTMGRNIQGACGQLGYEKAQKNEKFIFKRK